LDFALDIALPGFGTSIVRLFAAGQAQFDFQMTPTKVNAERNEGQSTLGDFADQATQLPAVKQQLTRPEGIVILIMSMCIRAYMALQ
jgi:hypothetical protein